MCGIVGEWRLDGRAVDPAQLTAARDCLTARGPDDAGLHVEGAIGLGHRRLSIIDLSPAGRMPMSNEDNTVWAVFNGEIYNFESLRAELEGHGHVFRSRTDSEVVIHAYEQWGTESFARFDGMFAIAIWDRTARRMVLARDITGEKPLHYFVRPGQVMLFASTVKALLASPEVPREVDREALQRYAELGFVPAPGCIIRGARKVQPGSFVVFEETKPPKSTQYWSLEKLAPPVTTRVLTLDQATDQLHGLLRAAVKTRLISDVPLGAFLSGGVD